MHVTLGADPGVSNFEEPVVDGAVRLMTVGAILNNRRMLPEKRSSPLSVAQVTGFIDACLFELGRVGSAVGIVAVGAG